MTVQVEGRQETELWINCGLNMEVSFSSLAPLPVSPQLTVPIISRQNGTLWHYVQYVQSGTVS